MADEQDSVAAFNEYRERMNARIMDSDSLVLKRFFNLDTNAYQEGSLDKKTKELLGLVASMVLRCDDCVKYHIGESKAAGVTEKQMTEAFEIALVVGGSIVIPHLRRAFEYMDQVK
jgi:AhpD family alkylhydroperoxidase